MYTAERHPAQQCRTVYFQKQTFHLSVGHSHENMGLLMTSRHDPKCVHLEQSVLKIEYRCLERKMYFSTMTAYKGSR